VTRSPETTPLTQESASRVRDTIEPSLVWDAAASEVALRVTVAMGEALGSKDPSPWDS
jgi:hypothetical protein